MRREELLDTVAARGALESTAAAERAVEATLAGLAEVLVDLDATVIASRLPQPWSSLMANAAGRELGLDEFYARVAAREGVAPSVALEHAQVVCLALAEALDPDARAHLTLHLEPAWHGLFSRRPEQPPGFELHGAARRRVAPGSGTTLATGKPGAHHPLSEAGPAHSQSVVGAENPHAATKLSSSPGPEPEREGRTLASGRPGSDRPLSESE